MLVYRRADGMRNFHRSMAEHIGVLSIRTLTGKLGKHGLPLVCAVGWAALGGGGFFFEWRYGGSRVLEEGGGLRERGDERRNLVQLCIPGSLRCCTISSSC